MAKFAIECPKCGQYNTTSTFNPFKKVISCGHCGEEINIKESRITSKRCPHCDNTFVYDPVKKKDRICPICGKDIDKESFIKKTVPKKKALICPQCSCSIEVDIGTDVHCPICDVEIDVKKELAKSGLVNSTGVSVIKYEGDNSTFIWKHPKEDFNTMSQLIVHESQEAIFF